MTTLRLSALAALAALACAQPAAAQVVVPVEHAPYHVPVFGNDYVIVLNVFIPPQRTSGFHRHSLDSLGVLIAETELTTERPEAAPTISPKRSRGAVSFSFYSQEPAVHAVTVSGDTPFHNIVIELVKPSAHGISPGSRDGVSGYAPVLDNERVRVWRLVLVPGAHAPPITQTAPGIRVVVAGGEIVERVTGSPDRAMAPHGGELYWQNPGVTRAVHNTGATRIEFVEVELK